MFGMWWTDVNIKDLSLGEEEEEEEEATEGEVVRDGAENGFSSLKVNSLHCSNRLPGPSMLMATINGHR